MDRKHIVVPVFGSVGTSPVQANYAYSECSGKSSDTFETRYCYSQSSDLVVKKTKCSPHVL